MHSYQAISFLLVTYSWDWDRTPPAQRGNDAGDADGRELEHVKPARSGCRSSGWIARVDFVQLGAGTRY